MVKRLNRMSDILFFMRGIIYSCLIVLMVFCISSCQNKDTNNELLNNNSSGMDQDHTAAPPDTIPLLNEKLDDTLQFSGQKSDTVKQE
jgi:hypothetical protein